MPARDPVFSDERGSGAQDDLRQQIADLLLARIDIITTDTVAIFPYSGVESLDADYCRRVGQHLAQLLAFAVRDGRIQPGDHVMLVGVGGGFTWGSVLLRWH